MMSRVPKQAEPTGFKLLVHGGAKDIYQAAHRSRQKVAIHVVQHLGVHTGVVDEVNRPSLS